jgi:hypothetical protein
MKEAFIQGIHTSLLYFQYDYVCICIVNAVRGECCHSVWAWKLDRGRDEKKAVRPTSHLTFESSQQATTQSTLSDIIDRRLLDSLSTLND